MDSNKIYLHFHVVLYPKIHCKFEENISLSLPLQFQIESLPKDLQMRNRTGVLDVSTSRQKRSASIKRTIQFNNSVIPANQFSEITEILKVASVKENTRVLLNKKTEK